jgi:uncharacterized protein YegL
MIEWDILVILDRSGSMQDAKADHEGGLRSFVEDQRAMGGDVRFTLVQFDTQNPCELVYDRVPIDTVARIELVPRGGTPLHDAIGKAVAHLKARQAQEPSSQTLVMIVTDGQENSSTEWTLSRVKALVTELEQAQVKVLFLGANIDAFAEGGAMGVAYAGTMPFNQNSASVGAAYSVTSRKVLRSRHLHQTGASAMSVNAALDYTEEERAAVNQVETTPTTTNSTE